MLYYLACQPEMVSRASLLLMFWENFNEQDARRRLRETLSKLRSQLPDPSVLLTEQDQVGLNHQNVYVDLDEFKNLYTSIIHAGNQFSREGPLPGGISQMMDRAIRLWRGPQFLSGAEFYESIQLEHWYTNFQEDLSQKRRTLQMRMADHCIVSENLELALDYLQPLFLDDELDPDVNFRFLHCLLELGRTSEALYRSQELDKLYHAELDIDLPPALKDLQNEIKKRFSIRETPPASKWNISISTSIPLFGRSNEMVELKRCFQLGGVTVLSGEAGSGKTRLVYELYKAIQPPPFLLAASASSLDKNLPFNPLIQIIRDHLAGDLPAVDPVLKRQLSKLMPYTFFEDNSGTNPNQIGTPEDRIYLFEAIHKFLLDLCQGQNILFFVDNIQWLDESTLEFLAYLYQQGFFQPNRLLVLARRPDNRTFELEEWQKIFKKPPIYFSVNLEKLDYLSIKEMANYILGSTPPEQTIQQLSSQTGGNPFFLIETMRIMLQSYHNPAADPGIDHHYPPKSINMLIQERLGALTRDTQKLLEAAAVLRNEFTPTQLEGISALQPEKVVLALEELLASHIIQVSNSQPAGGLYNFIHEIIREKLYHGLSLARRRLLHQKVARSLEMDPIPVHPAILAYHFEAGGEIIKAIEYWILAGEDASKLPSQGQAYQAYQQAESLLQRINYRMPADSVYRLYSIWGEMAYNLNDHLTMKNVYQKMAAIGRDRGDPLLIGSGLCGQAAAYTVIDKYQDGISLFEEAIQYLELAENTYEIIRAYNLKGYLHSTFCHFNQARISLAMAQKLGEGNPDQKIYRALISTDIYTSLMESSSGWPIKGIESAGKALAKSQQTAYLFGELRAYALLAIAHYNFGDYHKSLKFCHLGLERIGSHVLWRIETQIRTVAASCEIALGHLDEGLAHLKRMIQFIHEPGSAAIKINYHNSFGDIFRHLHAFSDAIGEYEIALEGIQVSHLSVQVLHRMSFCLFNLNRFDEAEKVIQEVIGLSKLGDAAQIYLQADLTRALVYAELGRIDEAHATNRAIMTEFNKRDMVYQQVSNDWVQGYLELKSQNYEKARHFAENTISRARQWDMVWLEIRGHELMKNICQSSAENCQPYGQIQRINELLELIGDHTKSPEIQSLFNLYRESLFDFFS